MRIMRRTPGMAKLCCSLILLLLSSVTQQACADSIPELSIFRQAYPGVEFDSSFDNAIGDWKIAVTSDGRTSVLYRADGRYLSPEQSASKEQYRQLVYRFPEQLPDPANFTPEQIERISRFGSTENRRSGPVSSPAFFDAIYDCATQQAVEKHIVSVSFLGKHVRVHEKIVAPLARVEAGIKALAQKDATVAEFIRTLGSVDGYYWRQIRDTAGKSFHSMGLAIDLLPRNWQSKIVYWNWEKNKGNEQWMLIPLSERWMPPESVVRMFEHEGFIWGGKWPVWDNMHFEYRPELLAGRMGFRGEEISAGGLR